MRLRAAALVPSRAHYLPPLRFSIKVGDLGGCGMPNMPPASGTYGDRRYLAHEGVTGLGGRTCSQGMTIDDLTKLDVFALGMTVSVQRNGAVSRA